MGKANDSKCVFPLRSLQIGDLQSYLSDLSLFMAIESNKFYVLVDNRPWLRDLDSRPTHLWQLMVTKSRLSPFANKARREGKDGKEEKEVCSKPSTMKSDNFNRWFSLIDAATLSQKRALLPVKTLQSSLLLSSELHRTLYGFIVFEVSWNDVRGINYLNELQTDTSLAIEAKFMRRWEFDSIAQAASCISSWFSGTVSDQLQLSEYLDIATATSVLYPICWTLWEILYAPIRLGLALASFVAYIFACISELVGDIWRSVNSIFQVVSASEASVTTYEVSMWRSLWNDLFSQVFRAVRSILNGFVAFFTACNRHRLSIYNHIQEFIRRLFGQAQISHTSDHRHRHSKIK